MLNIRRKVKILSIFSIMFVSSLLSHNLESAYYPARKLDNKENIINLEKEFLQEFPDFPNTKYPCEQIAIFFNKRNILYHFSKEDNCINDYLISSDDIKHHFYDGEAFIHFLAKYDRSLLIAAIDKASDDLYIDDKGHYSVNLPQNIHAGRLKPWQIAVANESWNALEALLKCEHPIGLATPYDDVAFYFICNIKNKAFNHKKYLLLLCLRPDFQYYKEGDGTNKYTYECNSLKALQSSLKDKINLYPLFEMIHLWRHASSIFDDIKVIDANYFTLIKQKMKRKPLNYKEVIILLCRFPFAIKNLDLITNVCKHTETFEDIKTDFIECVKSTITSKQLSELTDELEEFNFEFGNDIMDTAIDNMQNLKIDDSDNNHSLIEEIDKLLTKCSELDKEKLLSLQKEFTIFIDYSDRIKNIIGQIKHLKLEKESDMESCIQLCVEIQKTEINQSFSNDIKDKLEVFGKNLHKILYEFGTSYLLKETLNDIDIRKLLMEEFNRQHELICEINTYKSFEDSISSWKIPYEKDKLNCLVKGNINDFFILDDFITLAAGHATKAAK